MFNKKAILVLFNSNLISKPNEIAQNWVMRNIYNYVQCMAQFFFQFVNVEVNWGRAFGYNYAMVDAHIYWFCALKLICQEFLFLIFFGIYPEQNKKGDISYDIIDCYTPH